MIKLNRISFEHLLYTLAFLLALSVRFLNLGAAPLTEVESGWALQALKVSQDQLSISQTILGPQPAYIFLTAAIFKLLGTSDFLARFWPALAGSLLVLLPLFFRQSLGRPAGIIMSFGLALDPGLAAASRLVGSPIMALSFTLLAIGLWRVRNALLAGLFAGLALLSGPSVLLGLMGLILAWIIFRFIGGSGLRPALADGSYPTNSGQSHLRVMLFSAGAVILLAGSLFLYAPQGLSAWAETLPTFLTGWSTASGTSPQLMVFVLFFYQPLALLFAILAIFRALFQLGAVHIPEAEAGEPARLTARLPETMALLVWSVVALLLVLLYPARQVADLVWLLVPLWGLASIELAHHLPGKDSTLLISLCLSAIIVLLMVLFWLNLAGLAIGAGTPEQMNLRRYVFLGLIALAFLTSLLISLGWSWETGRRGLVWGTFLGLSLYSVSSLFGATQVRAQMPQEFWSPPPSIGQSDLLLQTLHDLSVRTTGDSHSLEIAVSVNSDALHWALRNFKQVRYVSRPADQDLPPVLLTPTSSETPSLAAAYRGQDFAWWLRPALQGDLPPNWVRWLIFRDNPPMQDSIILWAREDLFPGTSTEP